LFLITAIALGCTNADPETDEKSDSETDTKEPDTGPDLDLTQCAYGTKTYHHYFLDLGLTEDEVTPKIDDAWAQLFEGNPDDKSVYCDAGENDDGPMAYIHVSGHFRIYGPE
jgi:hypothetical protein